MDGPDGPDRLLRDPEAVRAGDIGLEGSYACRELMARRPGD